MGWPICSLCLMGRTVMWWVGPGRAETFEKMMGRAGPGSEIFKNLLAGPGRGPSSENLMGQPGTRPILWKFDGLGGAAAYHTKNVWAGPDRSARPSPTPAQATSVGPSQALVCCYFIRSVLDRWCTCTTCSVICGHSLAGTVRSSTLKLLILTLEVW